MLRTSTKLLTSPSRINLFFVLQILPRNMSSFAEDPAISAENKSLTCYTPCAELTELPLVSDLKTANEYTTQLSTLCRPLKHIKFDEGYTVSIDCSPLAHAQESVDIEQEILEEMKAFYNEYGFVVCSGVFNSEQCEETRDAMWSILEEANPGMKRDDRKTWESLKSKGRYGLSTRGPSFHPTLVKNRQNPLFVKILSQLTHAEDTKNVMVSHDRFTIYRATVQEDEASQEKKDEFRTGDRNLHLDLSPWWWQEDSKDITEGVVNIQYNDPQDFIKENNLVVKSMGRHVQCVLNFADNFDEDGGTIVVPYFHRFMNSWNQKHASVRKPLPWVTLPKNVEEIYMPYAHRVAMREGSVLIWDQRVLHGTSPNYSTKCRLAQYLKAGPRSLTYTKGTANKPDERLVRRTKALLQELAKSHAIEVVTDDVGKYVFGLDVLESNQDI